MPGDALRVVLVGPYPDDPEKIVGGVEAATSALATALTGHKDVARVTVASFYKGPRKQPIMRVNDKLDVRHLHVPFINGDVMIRSMQCVLAMRGVMAEVRPHIAHGQGIGRQGEIATQLGVPSVVTVHGLVHIEARLTATYLQSKIKVPMYDWMVRRVLRRAGAVISISDYDAHSLEGLIPGPRVSIPNPISPEFLEPHNQEPNGPQVLFAGVMRPRKNVLGLVNAFANVRRAVPAARLVIAGPAPDAGYAQQVHERVHTLGLSDAVEFLGHVSNEQLVSAMRQASVVALFSKEETSPTVLAQALAVGRPAVASRVGGIPEMVVHGENGYMVREGDEQALAEHLTELLRSPELCRAMGQRGQVTVRQRFEPAAVADQTVQVYRRVLAAAGVQPTSAYQAAR